MMAVADVSADTWQRMRRVPSSEMLNTNQLLEVACCFPLGHLVLCLWDFLCSPIPDSYDDTLSSSSSDDDADYEDMLAFDHNSYAADHHHMSSSSSTLDLDDYYYYSHSD
ncbi:hypothetical protein EUTSA_v10022151mg [Eutrema salsugineum]|uniref:Uncharacterized protein n=2 Tax=Eutrema salsugineum TaxID=72664 RepID=V4M1G9_EUTSA|nr:hypothetical protein EUTSA_v10022151mg [Eutrema salsugineum]